MAEDELVGNIATETIVRYMADQDEELTINMDEFGKSMMLADKVFPV
ncbi:MAG: hypothetical protein WDO15_17435 [Bacteroidota bacterium]